MANGKQSESRAADIIKNWIRTRYTIEFLGTWEMIHNPNFKVVEFDHFRMQAGLPSFVMSVSEWIEKTNAIGIIVKKGRAIKGTDTVLKTKLLSRKMACINIYSVFQFECPHNPMPCCKVFLRWGISKDKSAICLQTSRSNHVWRLSPVGVVFDVYGAVACCNPAFTCCF